MIRIKNRILVISLIIFGALTVFLAGGRQFYCRIAAPYPAAWLTVTPGMTSGEARKLINAPLADGRGLKSVDRWEIIENGIELHLDLWFDDQNEDDKAKVARVVRWKHFMGKDAAKVVDPPWPKTAEPTDAAAAI